MTTDAARLNPKIHKPTIGIKTLREITIYPIAVMAEIDAIETLHNLFAAFTVKKNEEMSEMTWIAALANAVKSNIITLLGMAMCVDSEEETKAILRDIDNEQFLNIVDIILSVNFGDGVADKFPLLMTKYKNMFLKKEAESVLNTQSPLSASDTPAIPLTTSTEETLSKAD